ncbi:hypothetical protein [Methanobacterium sp. SMA-27]|uniref:hypothetical protein n=1 Tax=Methanobacterium sp. SMA-27 TaxID=1495336 RepID=UPI00064FF84F|nr:hypothetical protein [Methanobacterium sp. SMA-27]
MNKIMKLAPILLFLIVIFAITPASATIHESTNIKGLKDVTIHQGENFTENLQVVFDGILGERGIRCMPQYSVHISIYHQNGVEAYYKFIQKPRAWGNKLNIYSDLLSEGTYLMTVTFDGDNSPYRFKVYDPCNESPTLTVLPKESKT